MDQEMREFEQKLLRMAAEREENTPASERPSRSDDDIAQITLRRIAAGGVPTRFREANLSNFPPEINGELDGFFSGTDSGLFICGPVGTGKTHLAVAILKELTRREILRKDLEPNDGFLPKRLEKIAFTTVPNLLAELRRSFREGCSQAEEDLTKIYVNAGITVLDDIGVEKPTPWVTEVLHVMIDRRYSEILKTIITSNLSIDEVADRLGDRIASRIAGMCKVIHLSGTDKRIAR